MPHNDPRFGHVCKMVAAELGVTAAAVDKGSRGNMVDEFLAPGVDGVEPRMALLFFYQPPPDGSSTTPVVFMTEGDIPLTGRCCYCVRLSDPSQPLPTKDLEDNLNFGILNGASSELQRPRGVMQSLMMMVTNLYEPLIAKKAFAFTKKMTPGNLQSLQQSTDGFTATLQKVCNTFAAAAATLAAATAAADAPLYSATAVGSRACRPLLASCVRVCVCAATAPDA